MAAYTTDLSPLALSPCVLDAPVYIPREPTLPVRRENDTNKYYTEQKFDMRTRSDKLG